MAFLLRPNGTWELLSKNRIIRDDGLVGESGDSWYPTFTKLVPSGAVLIPVFIGGSWVPKPLKRWNGSAWEDVVPSQFKIWNGSTWVQVP